MFKSIPKIYEHSKPIVVIAVTSIVSHLDKFLPTAAHLVSEGFPVYFTAGDYFKARIEATGATYYTSHGNANYSDADLGEAIYKCGSPPGIERLNFEIKHIFLEKVTAQYETIQALIAQIVASPVYTKQPIILLTDNGFLGYIPALCGAPWSTVRPKAMVTIGVSCYVGASKDVGVFNSGMPPDATPEGNVRNIAAQKMVEDVMLGPSKELFSSIVKQLGATEVPPFPMTATTFMADRYLQLSVPSQEYPRSDLPASVRFIGWVPSILAKDAKLPEWWPELLAAKAAGKKIAAVSPGTVDPDFHKLVIPTIEAAATMDVFLVVTLGSKGAALPSELASPENVRVSDWVPYENLIPLVDVFIGNGGYGMIQQSLYAGIPLVLGGAAQEKPENNRRAQWTGAAIDMGKDTVDSTEVKVAIEKIFANSSYKKRAEELSKEFAQIDALEEVVKNIEEIAMV